MKVGQIDGLLRDLVVCHVPAREKPVVAQMVYGLADAIKDEPRPSTCTHTNHQVSFHTSDSIVSYEQFTPAALNIIMNHVIELNSGVSSSRPSFR